MFIKASTKDELYKYMYEHHYDDIWSVNENQSIKYYTNDNKDLLITVTDLYAGFDVEVLIGTTDKELSWRTTYKDLDQHYKRTTKLDLSYEDFLKLVGFLENWSGEYGDSILEIKEKDNGYEIEWRVECNGKNCCGFEPKLYVIE